ncbi:MAG: NAD(P)H-dependent oxidoreductase [Bacteroidales bacterium]|jgi:putative NADPH-quinone reductase
MKKILIINGHPDKQSLCNELAMRYKKGAEASGAQCKLINLVDLNFNQNLTSGYKKRTELEPDLLAMQQEITNADHLVFVYPNWWGTYPALLKGFLDRVLLPGFAFKYEGKSPLPKKLLKGKTARLIVTMDTPKWFYWLVRRSPGHNAMKKGVLEFCGISPVKITSFGPVVSSDEAKRKRWILQVEQLGNQLK